MSETSLSLNVGQSIKAHDFVPLDASGNVITDPATGLPAPLAGPLSASSADTSIATVSPFVNPDGSTDPGAFSIAAVAPGTVDITITDGVGSEVAHTTVGAAPPPAEVDISGTFDAPV